MSDQRIGSWAQLLSTIHIDIHPPLYLLFAHGWNAVFGDSEISLRLPSLLLGLGSLPLAYLLAKRFVGVRAALPTVALLCLSPVHIWYSIEGRLYAPMLFAALLAVECFHRLLETDGKRPRLGLYLLLVACMLALHYYLAIYVGIFALGALIAPRLGWADKLPRRLHVVHVVSIALICAWVFGKAALIGFETSQGYLRPFSPLEVYRFFFQWSFTGNTLPAGLGILPESSSADFGHPRAIAWILFQVLGVLLFLRGLWELWKIRRQGPAGLWLLVHMLALPGFLFVLPFLGMPSTYIERSLLPSLPFFMMIVSLGLVSLGQGFLRLGAAAAIALLASASLWAYYEFDDEWTVYKPHQDWRAAASYFGRELEQGAAGRPIYTGMPNSRSLPYYDPRIQDAKNLAPSIASANRGIEGFQRVLGSTLGKPLSEYATRIAADFEAEKAELAAGTQLFLRPWGGGQDSALELDKYRADGVFYLLDNRWHHSSRGEARILSELDRFELLETHDFRGLVIYKLRERGGI